MFFNWFIQFVDNDENKTRHTVLEIVSKFPVTPNVEILKPIVLEILTMSMKVSYLFMYVIQCDSLKIVLLQVLVDDNEENALVAIRIIFDLHKTFKPALETQVQVLDIMFII